MKITLLHNESCPSTGDTLARLEQVLERLGEEAEVEVILVSTEAEARESGFLGSPTILIDGVDIEDGLGAAQGSEAGQAVLQACRIYRKPGGRVSPLPPVELIEQAIQRSRETGG